jgi:hypothetical protein
LMMDGSWTETFAKERVWPPLDDDEDEDDELELAAGGGAEPPPLPPLPQAARARRARGATVSTRRVMPSSVPDGCSRTNVQIAALRSGVSGHSALIAAFG